MLLRLPTVLKGRVWAVYDSLTEEKADSFEHMKAVLLKRLNLDTEEDRLTARDLLSQWKFRQDGESIDELARDFKRLLDKASPGLPAPTYKRLRASLPPDEFSP